MFYIEFQSWDIFQLAILPALLNNGELFFINDPKIQKSLEEFQYKLWRGVLAIPKSCPLPAMLYESIYYASILNPTSQLDCWNLYAPLKISKCSAGWFKILNAPLDDSRILNAPLDDSNIFEAVTYKLNDTLMGSD